LSGAWRSGKRAEISTSPRLSPVILSHASGAGRHPVAAFGNSSGAREMLEYASMGGGLLMTPILRDDAQREYAYDPAKGLPNPAACNAYGLSC